MSIGDRETGDPEHRVEGAYPGDAEGKVEAQAFHLPEWTSEPYERGGRWYVMRNSGCLGWEEEVGESTEVEPQPDRGDDGE